mmetsp:Transcript_33372/g.103056  ORF Transcript_33372/g.103056 Transcript_33372/m.103056 type:complete len:203 (-) Transcript_33372:464-1072(-)
MAQGNPQVSVTGILGNACAHRVAPKSASARALSDNGHTLLSEFFPSPAVGGKPDADPGLPMHCFVEVAVRVISANAISQRQSRSSPTHFVCVRNRSADVTFLRRRTHVFPTSAIRSQQFDGVDVLFAGTVGSKSVRREPCVVEEGNVENQRSELDGMKARQSDFRVDEASELYEQPTCVVVLSAVLVKAHSWSVAAGSPGLE